MDHNEFSKDRRFQKSRQDDAQEHAARALGVIGKSLPEVGADIVPTTEECTEF